MLFLLAILVALASAADGARTEGFCVGAEAARDTTNVVKEEADAAGDLAFTRLGKWLYSTMVKNYLEQDLRGGVTLGALNAGDEDFGISLSSCPTVPIDVTVFRALVAENCGRGWRSYMSPTASSQCKFHTMSHFDAPARFLIGHDTQSMLSRNDATKTLVLVFRGSEPRLAKVLSDWLFTDANLRQVDCAFAGRTYGKCHRGFYTAWADLKARSNIIQTLAAAVREYPDYRILVGGHSLGGALATIASIDLQLSNPGWNVEVVTFGSPRVGDQAFVTKWDATINNAKRIVLDFTCGGRTYSDIVTTVPPASGDQVMTSEASLLQVDARATDGGDDEKSWFSRQFERASRTVDRMTTEIGRRSSNARARVDEAVDNVRTNAAAVGNRIRTNVGEAVDSVNNVVQAGADRVVDGAHGTLQHIVAARYQYRHVKGYESRQLKSDDVQACDGGSSRSIKATQFKAHASYRQVMLDDLLHQLIDESAIALKEQEPSLTGVGEGDVRLMYANESPGRNLIDALSADPAAETSMAQNTRPGNYGSNVHLAANVATALDGEGPTSAHQPHIATADVHATGPSDGNALSPAAARNVAEALARSTQFAAAEVPSSSLPGADSIEPAARHNLVEALGESRSVA